MMPLLRPEHGSVGQGASFRFAAALGCPAGQPCQIDPPVIH